MKRNQSFPPAIVVPVLVYPDVRATVAWLTETFGFVDRTRIGESHRAQQRLTIPAGVMWTLPGYGDHLEENTPGLREQMAQMGAPAGFIDVIAPA